MNANSSRARLDACHDLLRDAHYREASAALDEIVERLAGMDQLEALVLQGQARRGEGRFEQALESFEHADELAGSTGSDEVRAGVLLEMARLYLQWWRDQEALDAIEQSLSLSMTPLLASAAVSLLGDVFARAGAVHHAEHLNQAALSTIIASHDDLAPIQDAAVQDALATRRLSLARLAAAQGQYNRALYTLEAIETDARFGGVGSTMSQADQAADITRNQAARAAVVDLLAAQSLLAIGDLSNARKLFTKALDAASSRGDVAMEVEARAGLGEIELQQGNVAGGTAELARAVDIAEQWLSDFEVAESRSGLRSRLIDNYGTLVRAASMCGEASLAWQTIERIRAREFLASLGMPGYSEEVIGSHGKDILALDRKIAALSARLDATPFLPLADGEARVSVGRLREERTAALDEKVRMLEAAAQGRRSLALTARRPASAEDVLRVLREDTALVQYAVRAGHTIAVVMADGSLTVRDLAIRPESVAARVRRFSRFVAQPPARPNEASWQEIGRDLYNGLFAPLLPDLRGRQRVCIVADGPLTELAFAAIGDKAPLVTEFEISYAPSSSILASIATPSGPLQDIEVFADPLPDTIWALPGTSEEAEAIAATNFSVRTMKGAAATPEAVLEAARTTDILHLACHANFDVARPLLSALMLASSGGGPARLEAHTIGSARVGARLVVLSACETGRSENEPAAELQGLVRAFIVAGARAVIGSLWRVADPATARLMAHFYGALADRKSPPAALRTAQLEMLGSTRSHPWYWAAFGLYGSGRVDSMTA